jgi:katanin p60 ATPase-containing subunit A1
MNSKVNTPSPDPSSINKESKGSKSRLMELVKQAREYAYLGMYEQAVKIYKDSLFEIESRKSMKKSSALQQAYSELGREVRRESDMTESLLFMIKNAKLPPSAHSTNKGSKKLPFNSRPFGFHQEMGVMQFNSNNPQQGMQNQGMPNQGLAQNYSLNRHTSLNKPMRDHQGASYDPASQQYLPVFQNPSRKFQEEDQSGNQYGQSPYGGHGQNPPNTYSNPNQNPQDMYGNPNAFPPINQPGQNPYYNPNQQQGYPQNNSYPANQGYQGYDCNDPANYRGFPPLPPLGQKDPMIWEPPSPKVSKQMKKPMAPPVGSKNPQPPGANNNYLDKHKREYEKPWLKKNTGLPPGQPKRSNSANKNPNCNVIINGVEKQKYIYSVYPDGNGPDADLINMIENNLITTNPNVTFDDIAGLQDAKEALIMYVVCSLNMKNFFKDIRSPPKGILLFGPPGTGKTMLAKAIATTGKTTFLNVNPATLASKWKGDSEKLVRILFEMARYYHPTTIFIDEIDSLLSERSNNEHESSRKVKTQFFTEIDGLTTNFTDDKKEEIPKVFILAATNRPWDLDDAIMRRLTKRIYIPLPNAEARRKLFEIKLKSINLAKDVDFDLMVQNTDRYNSDDIESVCREAAMAPFKRRMASLANQQSTQFLRDVETEIMNEEICMEDFVKAMQNVKSSASQKYTVQYDEWKSNHGSV